MSGATIEHARISEDYRKADRPESSVRAHENLKGSINDDAERPLNANARLAVASSACVTIHKGVTPAWSVIRGSSLSGPLASVCICFTRIENRARVRPGRIKQMAFNYQASFSCPKVLATVVCLLVVLFPGVTGQESDKGSVAPHRTGVSGALTRRLGKPLLPMGPRGSIDDDKTGPRVVLTLGPTDYRMWYEAVPAPNRSKVGYAVSEDGIIWTKKGSLATLDPSEAWEGGPNGEVSPNSILVEGGVYKLWYHSFGTDGKRRIGYATSADGLIWTKNPKPVLDVGPPGSLEDQFVVEPRVFKVGSQYRMYYGANARGETDMGKARWFYATSADGINWTRKGQVWNKQADSGYGIVFDGSEWHAWYGVGFKAINYASSKDGITWTDGPHNPVLLPDRNPAAFDSGGLGDSVSAYQNGNEFRIMYTGGRFNYFGRNESIMLATVPITD